MSLLSYDSFKKFEAATALSIIDAASSRSLPSSSTSETRTITSTELQTLLTPFDMKRLESYAESMIDYHVILDLVPIISTLYFSKRLGPECTLSAAQQAIILALGLQRKTVEALEGELGLAATQILALFGKILRKVVKTLQDIQRDEAGADIPIERPMVRRKNGGENGNGDGVQSWKPVEQSVEEELAGEVDEEVKRARAVQRELLDSMDMTQSAALLFSIWKEADEL